MADLSLILAPQTAADQATIDKLDERVFGPGRFARSAYRLREGVPADLRLSYVARVGTYLVGANRITHIRCGETPILLLGPLSVEPAFRSSGIGEALVNKSLEAARAAGHKLVILVGDLAYYQRMGFRLVPEGRLVFPGPVDPARLLYCPLTDDGLDSIGGRVTRARLG
ncbi:GNAT family N-acetyltransferase [Methylovirgula ligni]|uniref:Putative N-acetyltransferase YhbS n=1 Tax=Methylovirgula ligni TaxID=569860 RepID=A0A3D9YQG8_9HYPH|nr:N-acetyltransferase [Methylovirgula ligni]QAY94797.1 GNAT family N-acetyltransferase [Methylovirgula ligni]REF84784.1 putative N-acetyltransferase YhbS [Methylovirgula ligni]